MTPLPLLIFNPMLKPPLPPPLSTSEKFPFKNVWLVWTNPVITVGKTDIMPSTIMWMIIWTMNPVITAGKCLWQKWCGWWLIFIRWQQLALFQHSVDDAHMWQSCLLGDKLRGSGSPWRRQRNNRDWLTTIIGVERLSAGLRHISVRRQKTATVQAWFWRPSRDQFPGGVGSSYIKRRDESKFSALSGGSNFTSPKMILKKMIINHHKYMPDGRSLLALNKVRLYRHDGIFGDWVYWIGE